MQRILSLLPFLAMAVVATLVVALLFSKTSPLGGVFLQLSPPEIVERSESMVPILGVDLEGMTSEATFQRDQTLIDHLTKLEGLEEANRILRTGQVPGYFWKVTWRKLDALERVVGRSSEDEAQTRQVLDALKGELTIRVDPAGHLLGFVRRIPDTLVILPLGQDSARSLAQISLDQLLLRGPEHELDWAQELRPVSGSSRDQPGHRLFSYLWSGTSRQLGVRTEVELVIAGSILQKIDVRYVVPEPATAASGDNVREVIVIFLYILLIIAMIVAAIRIIRAFELGFRIAIIMGATVAFLVGYQIFISMSGFGTQQLIAIIIGPLFTGGGALLLWAVAESVTRETAREKFISFDLLTRGYLFHSYVGGSAVRGIALGLVAYALLLLGFKALGTFAPLSFDLPTDYVAKAFPFRTPLLTLFAESFAIMTFLFIIFVLFAVSWLRTRLPVPTLAVVIVAAVLGFNNFARLEPAWPAMALQMVTFGVVVWAFYQYDVLAGILALFTYFLTPDIAGMMFSGSAFYEVPATICLGATGVVLAGGAALQLRQQELKSFDDIMPAFARNITERQRLQQELEIARRVQMSFLPKHNPRIEGLDIAAQCAPALEVGGDYFDFIPLKGAKLGIAIGDVSGKGTQAAFYMTLAKGFLKALSPHHDSPAVVLSHLNKLFYENVERGAFISMVYATVDIKGRTITIARAGHNPVIMRKSEAVDVEVLQPTGLGLGLEAGETFAKTIEEVSVPFKPGDAFVFYTDGFSEAMNKQKQEFGEEQLYGVVNAVSGGSAQHILDEVFSAVRKFAGREKQHDDMTLVVLKIT